MKKREREECCSPWCVRSNSASRLILPNLDILIHTTWQETYVFLEGVRAFGGVLVGSWREVRCAYNYMRIVPQYMQTNVRSCCQQEAGIGSKARPCAPVSSSAWLVFGVTRWCICMTQALMIAFQPLRDVYELPGKEGRRRRLPTRQHFWRTFVGWVCMESKRGASK